jgi:hypothetical protein
MNSQSLFGVCGICGVRKGKSAMTAHLKQCLPIPANGSPRIPLMLLRVQAIYAPMYRMYVAAGRDAKFGQLDDLLRDVWLECCDHMGEFYTTGRQEISMSRRMSEVFYGHGVAVKHVYDFGTSTELGVYLAGLAEGTSAKPVIAARNEPPIWPCDVCGEPAASVCAECYEGGFSCIRHAKSHACGEEMLLPVVNSPRMGVRGYTG